MNSSNLSVSMAVSGLTNIVTVLVCILVAWWTLQQVRFDLAVRNPRSGQAKLLQLLVSIALGYLVARFLLDYLDWSSVLKGMF